MTTETMTIPTFTKDIKTGAHSASSTEITGQTFTATIGNVERKFIIHKSINPTQKNYALTDVKTGLRAGNLEATTKKAATPQAGHDLLFQLINKYGQDRVIQTFHNADLQAGLEPQT